MQCKRNTILTLIAIALVLPSLCLGAQDVKEKLVVPGPETVQMLTLEDGSTLVGRISEVGVDEIKFQTDLGEMTIAIAKIRDIKEVAQSSIRGGKYWFPNPNRTRMLIGPTARTLKAGEGYFVDLWVFFPGVYYGITDNITVGGGCSIIPGIDEQLYYFTPRLGFAVTDKLDMALSVNVLRLWSQTAYLGIGNMTYGDDDHSITCGIGFAWNDDGFADQPAGTLGGEYRLSRRTALVVESWFIPSQVDEGEIVMGALRLFGEQIAIDIGVAYAVDNKGDRDLEDDFEDLDTDYDTSYDATTWVPYIDFVYNF